MSPRVLNPAVWLRIRRMRRQVDRIHDNLTDRGDQLRADLADIQAQIADLRDGP